MTINASTISRNQPRFVNFYTRSEKINFGDPLRGGPVIFFALKCRRRRNVDEHIDTTSTSTQLPTAYSMLGSHGERLSAEAGSACISSRLWPEAAFRMATSHATDPGFRGLGRKRNHVRSDADSPTQSNRLTVILNSFTACATVIRLMVASAWHRSLPPPIK